MGLWGLPGLKFEGQAGRLENQERADIGRRES